MNLAKGATTVLPTTRVSVAVMGVSGVVVFTLDAGKTVSIDTDFACNSNPTLLSGVISLSRFTTASIDLAAMPSRVESVVVAVAGIAPVSGVHDAIITSVTGPSTHVIARATDETVGRAALLIEIYRRGGGWAARHISAGCDGGFSALLREHGVTVMTRKTVTRPG